jgi:hypothetical protein
MREVPAKRIETELKEIEHRINLIRVHLAEDYDNQSSGCNIYRDKIQWSAMEITTKTEKICDIIQGV